MSDALRWAEEQVAAARDSSAARLAVIDRTYHGPTGRAPRTSAGTGAVARATRISATG